MIINEEYIHRLIIEEVNNSVLFRPTEANVIEAFNEINKSCFRGRLPLCNISLELPQNYVGYFHYDGINNYGLVNPLLCVNGNYSFTMLIFKSVVAHEMIHYYLAWTYRNSDCFHGELFQEWANFINSKLGLNITEEVDTRELQYGTDDASQTTTDDNTNIINNDVIGNLRNYYNAIKKYYSELETDVLKSNGNTAISNFIKTLSTFCTALLNALERCVSKQSLNESGEFTKGINAFKNGYNSGNRFTLNLLKGFGEMRKKWLKSKNSPNIPKNTRTRTQNGQTNPNQTGTQTDPNNPNQTINQNGQTNTSYDGQKLQELLFNTFSSIQKQYYETESNTNGGLSSITSVTSLMTTISQLHDYVEPMISIT